MSIPVETLEVLIQANADQFRKELAEVNNKLSGIATTSNKTGKAISKGFTAQMFVAQVASQALVKAVSVVSRTIWNAGKQVVVLGSQYTRLKVATDTVTRNLGMTTTEVNDLRTALEEANTYGTKAEEVIKTLALSGLVEMARGLETVDARTGDTVTGIKALVLTMKDLGASAGVDSSVAISRLTKFVRTGNQSFADGIIEIGNINNAYREYAESIGKSLQELTEQERATVRLNIVQEEGVKSLGAYANTMQTSGKAMGSIRDATISLAERLGNYLEPVFASVTRAIFLFVDSARSALLTNANAFKDWANVVAGYVVAVVRVIGALLTRIPVIGSSFNQLATFELKPIVNSVEGLGDAVDNTANSISNATGATKDLKKELLGLAGFDELNVLKAPDSATGGGGVGGVGLGGVSADELFDTEEFNKNIEKINGYADALTKNWNIDVDEMIKKIKGFGAIVAGVFVAIGAVQLLVWAGIAIGTAGLIAVIVGIFVGGIIYIASNWDILKDNMTLFWNQVKRGWRQFAGEFRAIMDWIGRFFGALWEGALEIWNSFLRNLKIGWESWVGLIKARIELIKSRFRLFVTDIRVGWNNIKDRVLDAWNKIKEKVGEAIDWVKKKWDGFTTKVGGIGDAIWTAMKRGLNRAIDYINAFLGGLNRGILSGTGFQIAGIPHLATGGVVDNPTIAMIGEAGREAVMPLDRNTEWIDELAGRLNGAGQGDMNLVVKIGEDTIFEKTIDYINEKSLRSGGAVLNI